LKAALVNFISALSSFGVLAGWAIGCCGLAQLTNKRKQSARLMMMEILLIFPFNGLSRGRSEAG
jgi:hypothetical protein